MDQLKEVRDRIAERITEKKSMPLVEQIRYEKYLDGLYKMSIKTLNGEKINEDDFNGIFPKNINIYYWSNPEVRIDNVTGSGTRFSVLYVFNKHTTPWQYLNILLQYLNCNCEIGYYHKLCDDNKIFMFYVYDQFDEVLKQMK